MTTWTEKVCSLLERDERITKADALVVVARYKEQYPDDFALWDRKWDGDEITLAVLWMALRQMAREMYPEPF